MEVGGIQALRAWRKRQPGTVSLVPTMGALHSGHRALMDRARAAGDSVVTSIFVNPLQFGADEDFIRYPRPFEADLDVCEAAGVDFVFAPALGEMYPGAPEVTVSSGRMGAVYEGAARPGHFDGVLTVVAKLFTLTAPDSAVFGLKDIQQFCLVKRMIADLNFDIDLVGLPVVRDDDGLAMSSRNEYLAPADRSAALAIPRALDASAQAAADGSPTGVEDAAAAVLRAAAERGDLDLGYLGLVDAATFQPCPQDFEGQALLLVSASVGGTHLIDNVPLEFHRSP
ncbi:MAG: pantoate--beta-alanine ligase [Brevibacterium sp.]|nr:pantoate--beta-alanine ligase [Brevibacterium sp.]MDN6174611.1 pantoate--beta-alanine ligase [Brevibacterium sp.]MDN6188250.1 pantoate--beta-alanine ligase [Brevibacterium sp.]MDN6192338.1 pantoate--beta-alanine ligase [Brevibacterium sp.]